MVIRIRFRYVFILVLVCCVAVFYLCGSQIPGRSALVSTEDRPVSLPIFLYHMIGPAKAYQFGITPDEFENDLIYLSKNGYTSITMTQLINHVDSGTPLPSKPVILSFDDGYYNNYAYAYPLLKKYHAKMVLAIIGKSTDDFSAYPSNNMSYAHVTWTQINEMLDSGFVEVQNHTYNLHEISGGRTGCMQKPGETQAQYEKIMKNDVGKLQNEMTEMTGFTPNTFVYPYGRSSKNTDGVLKGLGFKATLSCSDGINLITGDPNQLFGLHRIERTHEQSVEHILKK